MSVAVLAVVCLLPLAVRALLPDELERTTVEREVAAEYEERIGAAVEVRCPDEMPVASGEVYACEGTRTDGAVIYVEIQIADPGEDADYRWWTPPA